MDKYSLNKKVPFLAMMLESALVNPQKPLFYILRKKHNDWEMFYLHFNTNINLRLLMGLGSIFMNNKATFEGKYILGLPWITNDYKSNRTLLYKFEPHSVFMYVGFPGKNSGQRQKQHLISLESVTHVWYYKTPKCGF